MTIRFLRGDPQAPKGHAIFIARSTADSRTVLATYCVVPPTPLSLAKYLPSFLASQMSPEDLQDATNVPVMPIPPMLEEGSTLEQLEILAERRDDDMVDLGSINPRDEGARMQLVAQGCQEYGQYYVGYASTFAKLSAIESSAPESVPLDDLDTEELLLQTMNDRQRLAELSKLVGVARYAIEGHDAKLVDETRTRMTHIARLMPEKYRGSELIAAATDSGERGSRLAQLYLERGYKLLDEEYADIPGIERTIRELQD
ncbi:MAG: hypothetical protein NVS3B14_17000 [Ktedonobacteraceae bacterium]